MGECLNAWDYLNAIAIGIVINLLEFFLGKSAAHMSEMRIFGQLISIFRVKHQRIIAHQCQITNGLLSRLHIIYRIAGHVRHVAKHRILFLFANRFAILQKLRQIGHRTEYFMLQRVGQNNRLTVIRKSARLANGQHDRFPLLAAHKT